MAGKKRPTNDRWALADKRCGQHIICATISPNGMRAFHTTAPALTPTGDFIASAGGRTFKQGLAAVLDRNGKVEVRPGCEKQFREQKRALQSGRGRIDYVGQDGEVKSDDMLDMDLPQA